MLIFSGGLVDSATAILGALASGLAMSWQAIALASVAICLVSWFLISQLCRLTHFYRKHIRACWTYARLLNTTHWLAH